MPTQQPQGSIAKRWMMILGIVAILAGGYYWFVLRTEPVPSAPTQAARVPGQRNIILLRELEVINLSSQLFDSTAFQSLIDYTVTITPEPLGRSNPFAPIGRN